MSGVFLGGGLIVAIHPDDEYSGGTGPFLVLSSWPCLSEGLSCTRLLASARQGVWLHRKRNPIVCGWAVARSLRVLLCPDHKYLVVRDGEPERAGPGAGQVSVFQIRSKVVSFSDGLPRQRVEPVRQGCFRLELRSNASASSSSALSMASRRRHGLCCLPRRLRRRRTLCTCARPLVSCAGCWRSSPCPGPCRRSRTAWLDVRLPRGGPSPRLPVGPSPRLPVRRPSSSRRRPRPRTPSRLPEPQRPANSTAPKSTRPSTTPLIR